MDVIIIIIAMVFIFRGKTRVKKYLKFTADGPAIKENPNVAVDAALFANFSGENHKIFEDIFNKDRYTKINKTTWTAIKSIEEYSDLIFSFFVDNESTFVIQKIFKLDQTNIDDVLDLRVPSNSFFFCIKIICADSNPDSSYFIFSITHIILQKKKKNLDVTIKPKINGEKKLYFQNHDFSLRMRPYVKDTTKIILIDISNLTMPTFGYSSWIYYSNPITYTSKSYLHKPNMTISILQQKYYYYDISDDNLHIKLLIHCKIFKNKNTNFGRNCNIYGNKSFCDMNGKEICIDPRMTNPPSCEKDLYHKKKLFCAKVIGKIAAQISLKHFLDIKCKCQDGSIKTCSYYLNNCTSFDTNYPKLNRKSNEHSEKCRNRKECQNGGELFHSKNIFICRCRENYFGSFCEINCGDFCFSNSCAFSRGYLKCLKPWLNVFSVAIGLAIVLMIAISVLVCYFIKTFSRKHPRCKINSEFFEIKFCFDQINEVLGLPTNVNDQNIYSIYKSIK